ncbi:MAG TPA: cation transporter [Desulfobacteria bacterium]|nr:cation transporter [Desulfobacteria bacterium]
MGCCCGPKDNASVVLKVEGMTCGHCKMAVEKAVKSVNGVTGAEVDLNAKQVKVTGNFDRTVVAKAIEDAGYQVVA